MLGRGQTIPNEKSGTVKWYRLIAVTMPFFPPAHNRGNDFSTFPFHFIESVADGIHPVVIQMTADQDQEIPIRFGNELAA
jgi:hypothetical protein